MTRVSVHFLHCDQQKLPDPCPGNVCPALVESGILYDLPTEKGQVYSCTGQ